MKIGESLSAQRPEVRLPLEIVTQIVAHLPSSSVGQSSAWACCLVSRDWYAAAISKLYARPRLSGPKFESFAAVICPPVNAHVRRVGLAHHVKYLDMSGIAYESTNSKTARLLRRVAPTLEEFVAPPTSFSTSCLAPISKCQRLRCLDLRLTQSHSFSRIDIYALLRSIGKLKCLVKLSLPPSDFAESRFDDARNASVEWPPNLYELQLNNLLPIKQAFWSLIVRRLPNTLNVLVVKDFISLASLCGIGLFPMRQNIFTGITSLRVNAMDPTLTWSLDEWTVVFPQLRFLSIPWQALDNYFYYQPLSGWEHTHMLPNHGDQARPIPTIEQLELTSDNEDTTPPGTGRLLTWLAEDLPHLWQVRLDEAWVERDELWADCQDVDILLKDRVKAQNQAAGHTIHDLDEAGVWFV